MSSGELESEWMASGDRSDPTLQMIDNDLVPILTYDGYQDDVKKLEAAFFDFGAGDAEFEKILFKVQQKQKMHEGDRTHPQLLQLDRLRRILNYDGWEDDFHQAEETHLESGSFVHSTLFNPFTNAYARLQNRQAISDGDRSDPWLMRLDSLPLTYPGWENDVKKATDTFCDGYANDHVFYTIEERQRVYVMFATTLAAY